VTEVGGVDGGVGVVVGGLVDEVPGDVPDVLLPEVAPPFWELELKGTPPEQAAKNAAININPANLTI
jgi:hypothetical protein